MKFLSLYLGYVIAAVLTSIPTGQSRTGSERKTIIRGAYVVNYPADWEADFSLVSGTDIMFLAPSESAESVLRANVSLTVQTLPSSEITLPVFVQRSESQIRNIAMDQEILISEQGMNGGMPFHRVVFNQVLDSILLRREQHYIVSGRHAYVLTYSAAVSNSFRFTEDAIKIMKSFRLQ